MKRYRIIDGTPVLPPKNAVDNEGRVTSNFAGRIFSDAAFAAAHGYYPLAEEEVEDTPLEGETLMPVYSLQNEEWVRHRGERKKH